jgi:hypothetical protein
VIGWLKWVEKTATGVNIHFARERIVFRDHAIEQAKKELTVPAALGDKFRSHNTPEDGCSYEVVIEDGVIGLKAMAYFKGGHQTVFIPAIETFPASGKLLCFTRSSSPSPLLEQLASQARAVPLGANTSQMSPHEGTKKGG